MHDHIWLRCLIKRQKEQVKDQRFINEIKDLLVFKTACD